MIRSAYDWNPPIDEKLLEDVKIKAKNPLAISIYVNGTKIRWLFPTKAEAFGTYKNFRTLVKMKRGKSEHS